MISIPIWLFILFVSVLGGGVLVLFILIFGYVFYCKYRDNRIKEIVENKYGTPKNK